MGLNLFDWFIWLKDLIYQKRDLDLFNEKLEKLLFEEAKKQVKAESAAP